MQRDVDIGGCARSNRPEIRTHDITTRVCSLDLERKLRGRRVRERNDVRWRMRRQRKREGSLRQRNRSSARGRRLLGRHGLLCRCVSKAPRSRVAFVAHARAREALRMWRGGVPRVVVGRFERTCARPAYARRDPSCSTRRSSARCEECGASCRYDPQGACLFSSRVWRASSPWRLTEASIRRLRKSRDHG